MRPARRPQESRYPRGPLGDGPPPGFDNLMRPFAVPVTGGVMSALLMFSLLVPSLSFPYNHSYEPPLAVAGTDVQWGDPDGKIVGASADHARLLRSEERRVGKECRSRWSADH